MRSLRGLLGSSLLVGVAFCAPADAQEAPTPPTATSVPRGAIRGAVRLEVLGVRLEDVGAIVLFLDAREGRLAYDVPAEVPKIRQHHASFAPSFLVIAAGQTVAMPNDDVIVHNVFSYSSPNDFDLGTYPAGEARSVTFRHAGLVRVYCSIHASMNATIFVAPSPYVGRADAGAQE